MKLKHQYATAHPTTEIKNTVSSLTNKNFAKEGKLLQALQSSLAENDFILEKMHKFQEELECCIYKAKEEETKIKKIKKELDAAHEELENKPSELALI